MRPVTLKREMSDEPKEFVRTLTVFQGVALAVGLVIGSGVLEHTALDYESLKELHRVIKPDGILVISYLPNWLSIKEWVRRSVTKRDFHRRLYGRGEATQLLKRSGFYPVAARYHTFFWEQLLVAVGLRRWEQGLSSLLARALPAQVFASTLCFVARKVTMM